MRIIIVIITVLIINQHNQEGYYEAQGDGETLVSM